MQGKLRDLTLNRDGTQNVTVTVSGDFRQKFDELRNAEVEIEIKKFRHRRSLSANAYFHVLVNKIAEALKTSTETVKVQLVTDYGTLARDGEGQVIGFKLPASADVGMIYSYTRLFDQRAENGRLFNCYLVYKPTHEMNTGEMSRLIDGTIEEAKAPGIETDTPETLARYKAEWERYEQQHHAG